MANGAFKFKDNSGNVVSFISGSGPNISFSGGTLDLSGMTGLTLGGLTISGSIQNAQTASSAPSYLLTSSFNTYSSSLATTGSNLFKGNQTISGSIIPAVDNAYDLGSVTHQFRDLYLSSASLYIDGTKVLGSTAQELQITTDTGQSFKILEAGSDTITLQSADGNITLTSSGGGDVIMDPTNGIIALKGTTTVYSGHKIVSSDGNSIQFGNGIAVTGSIISTVTPLVSGSSQISYTGLSNIPSGIISSSTQVTGFGFATTGSNAFTGTQTITGSLYISSDLVVQGSSSLQNITASAVNIGANIVNLNTANPAIRFAGLNIFDSGSIGGSGSFLYDAVQDEFIFVHRGDGTNITSSVVMMGPQTYNNIGSEIYPTANLILKGTGIEHVGDSCIFDDGTTTCIKNNLISTGTACIGGTSTISGNLYVGNTSTTSSIRLTGISVGGFTDGYVGWGNGNQVTAGLHINSPGTNFEITTGYNERVALSTGTGLQVYTNNGSGTYTSRMLLDRSGNACFSGVGCFGSDLLVSGIYRDFAGEALLQTNTSCITLIGSGAAAAGRALSFLAGNNSRLCISTTGIATFTCQICTNGLQSSESLVIRKDASSDNRYIQLCNTQTGGYRWDLVVRSTAQGCAFGILNNTTSQYALLIDANNISSFGGAICAPRLSLSNCNTSAVLSISNQDSTNDAGVRGLAIITDRLRFGVSPITSTYGAIATNGTNSGITFVTYDTAWCERVRIECGGSVGIGTSSPTSNVGLTVKRPTGTGWIIDAVNGSNVRMGGIYSTGGNNGQFYLGNSAGTETVLLDSAGNSFLTGGNFGIGETNATSRLTLRPPSCTNASTIEFTNTDNAVISSHYNLTIAVNNSSTQSGRAIVLASGNKGYGNQCSVMASFDADSKLTTLYGAVAQKSHNYHTNGQWYKIPFYLEKGNGVGLTDTRCIVVINNNEQFQELHFTIEYGSRLQGVSDQYTQTSLRTYGVNRFVGNTATINDVYLITGGSGCNINTHAPVTVAIAGSCMSVVKVDFSSSLGNSSFVWGEIRVWSIESLSGKISIPNNNY